MSEQNKILFQSQYDPEAWNNQTHDKTVFSEKESDMSSSRSDCAYLSAEGKYVSGEECLSYPGKEELTAVKTADYNKNMEGVRFDVNVAQITMIVISVIDTLSRMGILPGMNLDNGIAADGTNSISEGETDMSNKLQQRVMINGTQRWVSGKCQQDLYDKFLRMAIESGVVVLPGNSAPPKKSVPLFGNYARQFVADYKSKQESLTMRTREQSMKKHILPRFGNIPVDQISTHDIQQWYNQLADENYSRETILKLRSIMSPVFDSAVEDGLITINPMKSKRLKINTSKGEHHKALPPEKMEEIRSHLHELPDRERFMMGFLCYEGMRIEEVLGLKWGDIDFDKNEIHIVRAVIHPARNLPEIKDPKTVTSARVIPMVNQLKELLVSGKPEEFVIGSSKDPCQPISYTVYRKMFEKIRKRFDIADYSAHDFRDTCATEWREAGMAMDGVSKVLGHANTTVTEKFYVKYRKKSIDEARTVMNSI